MKYPLLPEATSPEDIDARIARCAAAAPAMARSSDELRARLLDALADALDARRSDLVDLADAETGLGTARLTGELDRTSFQLRGFAQRVRDGASRPVVDDPAVAGAPPRGHPRLVRIQVPVGPVAMFAASNFPFAFSVLGGDTASALAAGCPVVVKAHPGHPRLSRAVFDLARDVTQRLGWHDGTLAFVQGGAPEVGLQVVRHPAIAAVAFTGSLRGGQALWRECQQRPVPIPFFGELGSINPVVILEPALRSGSDALAKALAGSMLAGSGQFCTSPGLVLLPAAAEFDGFIAALAAALGVAPGHRMLTRAIRQGFDAGIARWRSHGALTEVEVPKIEDPAGTAAESGPATVLMQASAAAFLAQPALRDEVFGPAALIVRFEDIAQAIRLLQAVGGTLTVTLHGAEAPGEDVRALVAAAQSVAGRVLFGGMPTGVAVSPAQHHGGPWPASTAPQTTSVGYAALERFLRPVSLQDPPAWLLGPVGADVAVPGRRDVA